MRKSILLILLLSGLIVHSQPREKMEYVLRYGFIRGGKVVLESKQTDFLSKPAIYYSMRAQTIGVADKIYKVDDSYESIVDADNHLPLKSVRNIKERKYRYYNEIIYNNENDSFVSQRSGKVDAPENMVDILGLYFYMRKPGFLEKLKKDGSIQMPVNHDEDIFMMRVNYLGLETISTVLGDRQCMVVAPIVKKGKVLERDDGLKFYITNDSTRLPVFMEFEMKIGSVKCELEHYWLGGKNQVINKHL